MIHLKRPDSKNSARQPAKQPSSKKTVPNPTTLNQRSADPQSASSQQLLQLGNQVGNRALQRLIQCSATVGAEGGEVPAAVQDEIKRARGGGQALDKKVGAEVGGKLGADFSQVRVHTDSRSQAINQSLGAEAATVGNNIFFSKGAYNPSTSSGKQLLAHELTHVVQQGGHTGNKVQTKLIVGRANDDYEREANSAAAQPFSSLAARANAKSHPAVGIRVQRKLKFKYTDLEGYVSTSADHSGKLGVESTFSKIRKTLLAYENANNPDEQVKLLPVLLKLTDKWLEKFNQKSEKKKAKKTEGGQEKKAESIKKLNGAARTEIASNEYLAKFKKFNSSVDNNAATTDPFKKAKENYTALKQGGKQKDQLKADEQKKLDEYLSHKGLSLTKAERAAIRGYTTDQYKLMNPAMADNQEWFRSNLEPLQKAQTVSTPNTLTAFDKAFADNKEIAEMAHTGLGKLPKWKQDQTIYRGETVPQTEGDAIQEGTLKRYPHFVSTSLGLDVPRNQVGTWATDKRPFKLIHHIVASATGRNIAPFSNVQKEKEILFPKDTAFVVVKVLVKTKDSAEVQVKAV